MHPDQIPDETDVAGNDVDHAVQRASTASSHMALFEGFKERILFLRRIADHLRCQQDELVDAAVTESGGSANRLTGELERTAKTLEMFSDDLMKGRFAEAVINTTREDDLRRVNRPLGPVAVFEAWNMPFFLGVAGCDSISAWAAGCPVIVKGHPDHQLTSKLVSREVSAAARDAGIPGGTLSLVIGQDNDTGRRLVQAHEITAVAFTGSELAARNIAQHISRRSVPVPFYGELGSTNPVFITDSIEGQSEQIADALSAAIATNRGQVCTKPSLVFALPGPGLDKWITSLHDRIQQVARGPLMSQRVQEIFTGRVSQLRSYDGTSLIRGDSAGSAPFIFDIPYRKFATWTEPWQELFGPAVCVVRASLEEMEEAASSMPGQLTASVWTTRPDTGILHTLLMELEQHAGRLVFNTSPTGVPVDEAIHHGGPYPAATNPGTTSVGPASARRFQRPVSYQNAPHDILPVELRDENSLGISRRVNGDYTAEAIAS
jgi:NADP-dependent aldehyde dehydrogenase